MATKKKELQEQEAPVPETTALAVSYTHLTLPTT